MADRTAFAGLLVPGESDPPSVDGDAFFRENPGIIDAFLKIGAVTHRHDAHPPISNPTTVMSGSVSAAGGSLAPATTFYGTYTLVDAYGGETTGASAAAFTTPAGIGTPTGAPTATPDYTAGILPAGDYYYAKTFTDGAGGETPVGPSTLVYIDPGYASAQVQVGNLMADAPAGASTARLWRSYEGADWHLVTETTSDTYTDSGFDPPDNPALPPTTDSTNQTNALTLGIPADPAITSAVTSIRVYLSSDPALGSPSFYGSYPTSSAGSSLTVLSETTTTGEPPTVSRASRGAAKINPDTDMLDFPWKRPVTTFGALPTTGNNDEDVRLVADELKLYTWTASASAWNPLEGSGGGGLVITDGIDTVDVTAMLDVIGANGASATISDTGAGHATLTISIPSATGGGGGGGTGGSAGVIPGETKTAAYTLVLSDVGDSIEFDSPTAADITLPSDTAVPIPVGAWVEVFQAGLGQAVMLGDAGVTVKSPEALYGTAEQYATIRARKRAANEWALSGRLGSAIGGGSGPSTGPLVYDTFTDADGTDLSAHTPDIGAGWALPPFAGNTIVIEGGKAQGGTSGQSDYWNLTTLPTSDYLVEAEITQAAGSYVSLYARLSGTSAPVGYMLRITNTQAILFRFDAGGSYTVLGTWAAPASGARVGLQAVGDQISWLVAGVIQNTVTDATYAGPDRAGIEFNEAGGTVTADNFKVTRLG